MDILQRIVYMSMPNVLTIFIAIGMFCSLYPLRPRPALNFAACALVCVALSCGSTFIQLVVRPALVTQLGSYISSFPTLAYFVLVLLVCIPLFRLPFELTLWDAAFCCTAGYIMQNIGHILWQAATNLMPALDMLANLPRVALLYIFYLLLFALGYVTVIKNIHANRLEGEGDWRTGFVVAGVIAVNIGLSSIVESLQGQGALHVSQYLALVICMLMVSALTFLLDYTILFSNRMREDAAAARQLVQDQQRQYELSAETIEAINVRCHDIRHQVRQLSTQTDTQGELLEEISGLISVYDAGINTHNKALDVILTEKSLLCQGRSIQLACTADGKSLSHMAEQDIYSLFGNALDNAIEAVEKVRDPERRLIDVSTHSLGQMLCVQVRNYYDSEPQFVEDGSLATSKKDGGLHGYGTRSMRLVAERYDGSCSFEANDGLFCVSVLLPVPA
ncbi:ATP-binding protein [Paratractidigestivibacter sp.]|uniref:ATP-binding protein n=1 Tax=Paratractidigestivibacter sp. TaxID=2847316 RepID=UPI002AC955A9|nr:ATP-binding protein [Paratractidigestivibacter sp.]